MELIKWNQAKTAIAACETVDEVIHIKDKAEAMRAYAKQIGEGLEMQNSLAEIKLRAERRAGEILKESEMRGRPKKGDTMSPLKEYGIQKKESSRWQSIANIPEPKFEEIIIETQQAQKELTETMMLKVEKELKKADRIGEEKLNREEKLKDIDFRHGDFKDVLSDVYGIDTIITDPPYPYEYIQCFSDLALYAKEHMKKDGFLVTYSGQYHLPEVIERLSEHLTYVWTFCLSHVGKKQLVNGVNIMCGWKPVLIFSNGKKKMRFSAYDVVISEAMEKFGHEWQQSETGIAQLIEIFSEPGNTVVDPFAGSGTTLKVAHEMERTAIGAEIK